MCKIMIKTNKELFIHYVNYPVSFQIILPKLHIQAPNTTRTISCKAWNSLIQFPNRKSKHDIRSPKATCSIQYAKRISRDRNVQEGAYLLEMTLFAYAKDFIDLSK